MKKITPDDILNAFAKAIIEALEWIFDNFALSMALVMFGVIAFFIALAALTPKVPHWSNVCVRKEVTMEYRPTTFHDPNTGKTITESRLQPVERCAEREWHCLTTDPDTTCPPMDLPEVVYE